MATSNKKLNGTRGEYYSMTLSYVENSYSIENNTSNVTITGTIQSDSSYYSYYGYTNTGKLSIDGTEVKTGTSTANVTTSGVTLFTYTGNIAHSSDGTKTATLKFDFSTTYSYLSSTSLSVNFTLTTIPRASTLTLTASSLTITNATATLGFTATSKGNFYHKLSWKVGSSSASVVSGWNPKQINTTSASGTITTGAILDKMPTSTSGTLTFTLETFTDSAMTNKTGTSTATCSISINTSNIKPSVSLGTIGVNTPSSFTNLVAGYSTAKVTVTSTNSRGASSFSTSFTISKGSLSANSTSSTSYTLKTNTLPSGTSNYTFTITATITDSRGVSATASKTSGTVYGYATPVISAQFYRVAESGSSTADPIGGYVYRSFSATQSYTVNGWNNTLTVTAKQDGTTVTSGTTSALADTSSSTLVVTATDKVTTVTKTLTVGTATFPLDLYDDAEGTVGVGMGTTAVGGLVKSNMHVEVTNGTYDMRYTAFGLYDSTGTTSTSNDNRILGTVNSHQDILIEAPSRRIMLGFYHTTEMGIYVPQMRDVKLNSGVYLTTPDSSGTDYQLIGDNGTNLWIGGRADGTRQHVGRTFLATGYDSANSQGNPSIRVAVTNDSNTGSTNYWAYHEGYFPPMSNTLSTSGIAVYSSRCTRTNGGYARHHQMCYVNLYITINTSLGTNSNWTLFTGFPKPLYETALACAPGPSNTGSYSARVDANGNIMVCTGSTALSSGKIIIISGWYMTAS